MGSPNRRCILAGSRPGRRGTLVSAKVPKAICACAIARKRRGSPARLVVSGGPPKGHPCPCGGRAESFPRPFRPALRLPRRLARRKAPERLQIMSLLCVLCASRSPVPDAIYLGNSVTAPGVTLPRQLLLRCPTSATAPCVALPPASMQSSYFPVVVLPALPYLGNRSLRCSTSCVHAVVLHPYRRRASLQSSCIPAVVLDRCSRRGPTSSVPGVVHPWSRVYSAFLSELNASGVLFT
jgi:hypothetical protein